MKLIFVLLLCVVVASIALPVEDNEPIASAPNLQNALESNIVDNVNLANSVIREKRQFGNFKWEFRN